MAGFVMEWSYAPPDFLEEPIMIREPTYVLMIDNGKAEAKTTIQDFEAAKKLRDEITEVLEVRFLSAQVLNHCTYKLSQSSLTLFREDGTRNYIIEPATGAYTISAASADFTITDKDGNPIADTKRDRIDRRNHIGEMASTRGRTDPLVKAILRSYNAAVTDGANELIHLYEIREALVAKYGSENNAKSALKISSREWSSFGRLCNNAPLLQGRHRGRQIGQLRSATDAELGEARELARKMIERYIGV